MSNWHKKPTVLVGTAVETSAAFTGAGFTNNELGFFVERSLANTGATITVLESPFFVARKGNDATKFTLRSSVIDQKKITGLRRTTYTAPVAQVTYAGYNGTDGSLSFDCDSDYGIRVIAVSDYIRKHYNSQGLVETAHIHTECCEPCDAGCDSAVCYTETAKFVKAFNEFLQLNNFVGAEIVVDGAASDVVTGIVTFTDASTMTLTNGSKRVVLSANATIPTGTYLRIGGGNPPINTDPVYLVATGVTAGTVFYLDTPWQGATATKTLDTTLADSDVAAVTLADVTACGIKFTGKFYSPSTGCCCFPPYPFDFEGTSFIVTDSLELSFPCTDLATNATALVLGNGTAKEILYMEMDAFGYSDIREWFRDCASNLGYSSQVDLTANYDVWDITYFSEYPTTPQGGSYDRTDYIVRLAMPTTTGAALDTMLGSLETLTGVAFIQG